MQRNLVNVKNISLMKHKYHYMVNGFRYNYDGLNDITDEKNHPFNIEVSLNIKLYFGVAMDAFIKPLNS